MKKSFIILLVGIVAGTGVSQNTVLADDSTTMPWFTDNNCLYKQQTSDTDKCYSYNNQTNYGAVEYDTETGITSLASSGSTTEAGSQAYSYIDSAVNVAPGDYIVMIAFTQAEIVRESPDITGLPYVYGYQMTDSSQIDQYMQGQETLYNGGEAGNWDLSYGIFPVTNDAVDRIRFFMNQAGYNGSSYDGSKAFFKRPGVFVVSTQDDATSLINYYKDALNAKIPDQVEADVITNNSITLDWAPQENADEYIIKVKRPHKDKIRKFIVEASGAPLDDPANEPVLEIENLKSDKTYRVWMRAVVNGVKGDWSPIEKIHTAAATE